MPPIFTWATLEKVSAILENVDTFLVALLRGLMGQQLKQMSPINFID